MPVGFFTAGGPMANDAGVQALTGPRSPDEVRRRIAAAGYKGERLVMVAPSDLPAIMAMSQVMQDQLSKMGLNIDFQVMDWGTMSRASPSVTRSIGAAGIYIASRGQG